MEPILITVFGLSLSISTFFMKPGPSAVTLSGLEFAFCVVGLVANCI